MCLLKLSFSSSICLLLHENCLMIGLARHGSSYCLEYPGRLMRFAQTETFIYTMSVSFKGFGISHVDKIGAKMVILIESSFLYYNIKLLVFFIHFTGSILLPDG